MSDRQTGPYYLVSSRDDVLQLTVGFFGGCSSLIPDDTSGPVFILITKTTEITMPRQEKNNAKENTRDNHQQTTKTQEKTKKLPVPGKVSQLLLDSKQSQAPQAVTGDGGFLWLHLDKKC